jgi:PRTRC genetic system protein E
MFKELAPLIAERKLHLVLAAAKDGRITIYAEPMKKADDEADAFVTPLRLTGSPEELDEQLGATLIEWVADRAQVTSSLAESLAASKRQLAENADAAKKEAAEKAKKRPVTPAGKTGGSVTPSAAAIIVPAPAPSLLSADGEPTPEAVASTETSKAAIPAVTSTPAPAAVAVIAASFGTDDLF